MPLVLSDREQKQFEETSRVLLAPLDQSMEEWRAGVLRNLASLLGTETGGFVLPMGDGAPYTLLNLPDRFAQEYFARFQPLDRGMSVIAETESSIWSTRMLVQLMNVSIEEGWFGSTDYLDFYSRYGIEEGIGFVVPTAAPPVLPGGQRLAPGGAGVGAVLTCFTSVFGTEHFGKRGVAILRMLLPALEAGVAGRVRLAWIQTTLQQAFDLVRDGLQIRDVDGRCLHANAALARILLADPQPERIDGAMERAASALMALLAGRRRVNPAELEASSSEVRTARGRYRVRGNLVDGAPFGERPMIIISLERLTPEVPAAAEIQVRWGLSPQEGRVAALLAQGVTNAQIAAALELSPATVRHYTEAVFLKLQVHSRGQAARRILTE